MKSTSCGDDMQVTWVMQPPSPCAGPWDKHFNSGHGDISLVLPLKFLLLSRAVVMAIYEREAFLSLCVCICVCFGGGGGGGGGSTFARTARPAIIRVASKDRHDGGIYTGTGAGTCPWVLKMQASMQLHITEYLLVSLCVVVVPMEMKVVPCQCCHQANRMGGCRGSMLKYIIPPPWLESCPCDLPWRWAIHVLCSVWLSHKLRTSLVRIDERVFPFRVLPVAILVR